MPRATSVVVYSLVVWSFLVEIVGGVVRANHWLLDLSLFHHLAPAPATDPRWAADAVFVVIGLALSTVGTVFFARVGLPSIHSYFAAAELVFGIVAGLYFMTLLLVGLLPKHAQQAHG